MPGSTFGKFFTIHTFGESHGGAVGVVVDGVPAGLELTEADIQPDMDRRKPGQSDVTTPRKESDTVNIMSGTFEGKTTGAPILVILYNQNTKSEDYLDVKNKFRPGHADFTWLKKFGIRDWRGSGRASGRETAARVAAGAIAKKILKSKGISILAYTKKAVGISCKTFQPEIIEQNSMRACDPEAALEMEKRIIQLAEDKNSGGGLVECRVNGLMPGLGDPVFDKLDGDLAGAIMGLGAVKGFELGSGFDCVDMTGLEHNDEMDENGFTTNNAGGINGGISNGDEIIFRCAVKPTSSIASPQKTITLEGKATEIETEGRHDPCICPRIIPVVEAMTALVLVDHLLRQKVSQMDTL